MIEYNYKYYRRTNKYNYEGFSRKTISEANFFKNTDNITELYYRYNGDILGYEVSTTDMFFHEVFHLIRIGRETTSKLAKYMDLKYNYTDSSIKKKFQSTRALGDFILTGKAYYKQENKYYPVSFVESEQTLSMSVTCLSHHASDEVAKKNLQILTNLADRLWRDISDLGEFNTYGLVKRQLHKTGRKPDKKAGALDFIFKFCAKLGVKMIANSFGAKAEIPDDAINFDIDTDYLPDNDYDVSGNNFYDGDFSSQNGYNVSFGKKFTLRSIGGLTLDVDIKHEPGSSSLFQVKWDEGVIHNVKRSDNFVEIEHIKYRLPSKLD